MTHEQLYEHLSKHKLLYNFQSGFRKAYSTDSFLLYLTDLIKKTTHEGNIRGMVLLDLQKAFDTVNHELLITKLKALGLSTPAQAWQRSYLSHRDQLMEVTDHRSEACPLS